MEPYSKRRHGAPNPKESLKKIVIEATHLVVKDFIITGGEPFISKDMYDIINYIVEHDIYTTITTKAKINFSKFSNKTKDNLVILQSLDSTNSSLVSTLTENDSSLDDAMYNIDNFRNYEIPFKIRMVVGKHNLDSIPEMANICKYKGATSLILGEYFPSPGRNMNNIRLNNTLRKEIVDISNKLSLDLGINIELRVKLS